MTWREYLMNLEAAYKPPEGNVVYLAWWRLNRWQRKRAKKSLWSK